MIGLLGRVRWNNVGLLVLALGTLALFALRGSDRPPEAPKPADRVRPGAPAQAEVPRPLRSEPLAPAPPRRRSPRPARRVERPVPPPRPRAAVRTVSRAAPRPVAPKRPKPPPPPAPAAPAPPPPAPTAVPPAPEDEFSPEPGR